MSIDVTRLPNGLTVASDRIATVETVSLGAWVGVGTRHEPAAINGVAHLLEHMAFKGTERRSAYDIAREIEAVGGHLNAYTSRESTAYYARVLADDAPLAVDIIADILQHPTFDNEELTRERAVVLQEIGQAYDTPDDNIFDRFQETAYPGQAVGRPVLGTGEIVSRIDRDTLRGYMSRHYGGQTMVIAAAGKIEHARLLELVTDAFADLPREAENGAEPAVYRGGDYREENFKFDPDSGYNANQDYPNVVQNIILPVSVDGSTDVQEVYAELVIPVVKDLPFIKSFEVDPGVRYSEYNTAGGIETYKVLGDLAVNDWVRFRGGYQVANRAANVTELFTPKGGSSLEVGTDACANYPQTQTWGNVPGNPNRSNVQTLCQYLMVREGAPTTLYEPGLASANNYSYNVFGGQFYFPFVIGVTEGNPNLESESADTFTAGVVFNSPFDHPALERMTLSVDWYLIEITNAIKIPNHDVIYQQCLDAQYNSLVGSAPGSVTGAAMAANNPFCALIQREYVGGAPLTPGNFGADRKFSAQYLNAGGINSQGIDIQFIWGSDLADLGMEAIPGSLSVNVLASYLDLYEESPFPGSDSIEYTGSTFNSSFDYRLLSTFGYSSGPLSIGLRWQHLPSLDTPPGSAVTAFGVESHDQIDLFGRWSFGEHYELRAGIDNLINGNPEVVGANSTNNALGSTNSNYDQIGRRFYLGVTARF